MKWTIAILTIPERKLDLGRIVGVLKRQITDQDVEIIVADQDWRVGRKRQWCLDTANGEYFNFVDDDDLVAHDYIDSIYPLLDGVDYIGFQMQLYWDGEKMKPTYHSLQHDRWWDDDSGYYRNVSHLNPIRTEIARQGRFDGAYPEDVNWARQVHPETEHYVDHPMYFYFFAPEHSKGQADGNP